MPFDPDAYLAEGNASPSPQGQAMPQGTPMPSPSPKQFDPDAYLSEGESTAHKILNSKPVQYGLRGLDYLGGMGRVAASGIAGLIDPKILKADDVLRMIKGQAPSTKEYMERAGVPQGGSLSDVLPNAFSPPGSGGIPSLSRPEKGGPLDVTARGAAGFAGDVALDPLTYLTMGVGNAAKAAAQGGQKLSMADRLGQLIARPAGTTLDAAGSKIYNSGLKNVDKVITSSKVGKEAIAPELMNAGKWGNAQTLADANQALRSEAGRTIGNVAQKASEKGAVVDMLPATEEAWKLAMKMKESPRPEVVKAGEDAAELLTSYVKRGKVPVDEAMKWATEANKFASRKAFAPLTAADATYGEALDRAIGQGIAGEASSAIKGSVPELHPDFLKANQVYGSAKAAGKPFETEVSKEATKNPISAIDGMILASSAGSAALHNPSTMMTLLGTYAGKKAAQGMNTMAGRTGAGLMLRKAAVPADPILRRSAWAQLLEPNQNEEENQ